MQARTDPVPEGESEEKHHDGRKRHEGESDDGDDRSRYHREDETAAVEEQPREGSDGRLAKGARRQDQPDGRGAHVALLEEEGHAVATQTDGEEADEREEERGLYTRTPQEFARLPLRTGSGGDERLAGGVRPQQVRDDPDQQ